MFDCGLGALSSAHHSILFPDINAGMKAKWINWEIVKYPVNQAVIKRVMARHLSLALSLSSET